MEFKRWWTLLGSNLAHFIHLQLFLTLISWPILIAWGLPLSLMSPLGNLIFGPVMTLFLFLSSLIFLCELIYIPNDLFIWLLDKLTHWWMWSMSFTSSWWLIGTPLSTPGILILLPLGALLIVHYKSWKTSHKNIFALSFLCLATTLFFTFVIGRKPKIFDIPGARGTTIECYAAHKTALVLGSTGLQERTIGDFIEYTLFPELIKKTGSPTIHFLIIIKPSTRAFQIAEHLCNKEVVKNIYIIKQTRKVDIKAHQVYQKTCAAAQHHNIKIHLIDDQASACLDLGQQLYLKIQASTVTLQNSTYFSDKYDPA